MFIIAINSKLRGCDVLGLKVDDVASSVDSGSGLELEAGAAHSLRMPDKSKFYPKTKDGRWTVRIFTGRGPDSHVGDFATEEEAKHWISTKSKDWEAAYDAADKSK